VDIGIALLCVLYFDDLQESIVLEKVWEKIRREKTNINPRFDNVVGKRAIVGTADDGRLGRVVNTHFWAVRDMSKSAPLSSCSIPNNVECTCVTHNC